MHQTLDFTVCRCHLEGAFCKIHHTQEYFDTHCEDCWSPLREEYDFGRPFSDENGNYVELTVTVKKCTNPNCPNSLYPIE